MYIRKTFRNNTINKKQINMKKILTTLALVLTTLCASAKVRTSLYSHGRDGREHN